MRRFSFTLIAATTLGIAMVTSAAIAQDDSGSNGQPRVDPLYQLPPPPAALHEFYQHYDAGQRALDGTDDPYRLAVPVSRSVAISLTPGAQTNIIRIAQGFPASVTFLDDTGQSWPIAWDITTNKGGGCDAHGQGQNPAVRSVGIYACVPDPGSNVLQLTPISRYAQGGLLVSLQGAAKPIAFMIIAGTGSYDADLTARIGGRGPNAKDLPVSASDAPTTGSAFLTAMLDGAPPASAEPLQVAGVSADRMRAWKLGDSMYLRTDYQLVSPAPTAQESEYGTTIYEIPETSEVLVASEDRLISISLAEVGP